MYTQITLPYGFHSLEPYIDELTLETHYSKHHMTYTNNLNVMAEKACMSHLPITQLLSSLDQVENEVLRTGLRNNGGGFYNHNLYFSILGRGEHRIPSGKLAEEIKEYFGSFETFVEIISSLAVSQFGSGWAWLSVTPEGELVVSKSQNQDNPISLGTGNIPIFTIDVWEHAYYLKYRNMRAEYVKNFFNVVNWSKVEQLYEKALQEFGL